ncbi:MAG: tetratricopeptide repeat protein [Pseudomonadota bacterium]
MKKNNYLLPLLASLPALFSCSTPATKPTLASARIEPVMQTSRPDDTSLGYYQLGRFYQGQNRLDLAAEAYRKAIGLSASFVEAHNALGTVYSKQGKYEDAITELSTALKIVPDLARVYNNLGYTYYLQNNFSEAVIAYEKAIALEPGNPRTYNNLGAALGKLGDTEKSRLAFARAEELNSPTAAVAANNEKVLPVAQAEAQIQAQVQAQAPTLAQVDRQEPSNVPAPISIAGTSVAYQLPTAHESIALAFNNSAGTALAEISMPADLPEQPSLLPLLAQPSGQKSDVAALPLLNLRADRIVSKLFPAAAVATNTEISYRPAVPAEPAKAYRLEIANGNGVTGLATKVRKTLALQGVPAARLTNIKPYREPQTLIQYRAAYMDQALLLSKKFLKAPKLVQDEHLRSSSDLRLVLGKDVATQLALFGPEGVEENMRLAYNAP